MRKALFGSMTSTSIPRNLIIHFQLLRLPKVLAPWKRTSGGGNWWQRWAEVRGGGRRPMTSCWWQTTNDQQLAVAAASDRRPAAAFLRNPIPCGIRFYVLISLETWKKIRIGSHSLINPILHWTKWGLRTMPQEHSLKCLSTEQKLWSHMHTPIPNMRWMSFTYYHHRGYQPYLDLTSQQFFNYWTSTLTDATLHSRNKKYCNIFKSTIWHHFILGTMPHPD